MSSSDENYKRSIKSAYLRQTKKLRSREEQRLLAENSKRRRGGAGGRARRRDWNAEEGDEFADFEPMRPAAQLDLGRAKLEAAARRDEAGAAEPPQSPWLVVAVARDRVHVSDGAATRVAHLAADSPRAAVGDSARVEQRPDGELRLAGLGARRSALSRPDPGNAHRERVLAANVDVAVIVASVAQPAFRPGLVDRFLIAIQRGGIRPLLAINKLDLLAPGSATETLEEQLAVYEQLGVELVRVSADTGEGLERLREKLAGLTCVLVGHSGVGKSTILNALYQERALDPERALAPCRARDTGGGREFDGKGRHTTTSSELSFLPGDTRLIDTPGIRTLGLWSIAPEELADSFPDFAEARTRCRFRDCSHLVEPHCGVRAAVAGGEILEARYRIYARFHAELRE